MTATVDQVMDRTIGQTFQVRLKSIFLNTLAKQEKLYEKDIQNAENSYQEAFKHVQAIQILEKCLFILKCRKDEKNY